MSKVKHVSWKAGLSALLLLIFCSAVRTMPAAGQVTPPMPLLPVPTARQMAWQESELIMFLHFGVNTFTDREWGEGTEDPSIFNPAQLDASQWVRVAKETGFQTVILTAKHHDGFCLWPSAYTEHSVKNSPWRNGQGDVVRELADACQAENIRMGLYLSPWDRHEPTYGEDTYNQFYTGQLRELLTQYGTLSEIWFDGAKGEDAKDMTYNFDAYWSMVRQLQPGAVLFSDEGPDVRWIGNERGFAGETNWSRIDRSKVQIGAADTEYLNSGDRDGPDWVPGECDVSIRRGWFWHEDQSPKTVEELMDIYYKSVGRNCTLLLNVPPDNRGLLPEEDVQRLREFKAARDAIFETDFAAGSTAQAENVRGGSETYAAARTLDGHPDTYWATDDDVRASSMEVDLGRPVTFNVVRIQEPVTMGQRVEAYHVQVWEDGNWKTIHEGTTIGYKRLARIEPVTAQRVRLVIDSALACPLISEFGLHFDPN